MLDSPQTLLHSSFGIGCVVAQAPPSIFPSTAPAVRLRVQPTETTYLPAAAYDGTPRATPRGAHFDIDGGDGTFYAGEGGMLDRGEGMERWKVGAGRLVPAD